MSVLDRSDVDTDQIIPKQFLKRVERTGFGEFLFYDWAKQPGWELPQNPILATGRNFGCGSSREHAPWALEDYGFEAVIAPSFADIFYSNCTKIGLLPVVLAEDEVRARDGGGARLDRPRACRSVTWTGGEAAFEIDPEIKRRLLEGLDDIGVTLQQQDAIDRYEAERERSGPVTTEPGMTRDWDAATYDRVSAPQVEWALRVLERLPLRGDETVLDAGCGSGRVTQLLLERLPRGHVVAVDSAPSMVEHAREALDPERATVFQANLTELVLDEPVDAAFSNAVFHWIADHDALFARLHAALRPGGRLVAQCGGEGNVERFHEAARAVAAEQPYAHYLARLAGAVELRGRRGDGRAARARRLHGGRDVARALSRHAAGPDRLPAHRVPRPPPGAAAGAAQGAVRGGRRERCGTELDYVRLNIQAKTAC